MLRILLGKVSKPYRLPLSGSSHKANSQIQQTRAWPTWNGVQIKSMPLPPTGFRFAEFLPPLGKLFVLLKAVVGLVNSKIIFGQCF